jgi:DNA-binding response OmpR family regulator
LDEKPILIVEDDPLIRENLQEALQSEGYLALTAENGQVALDLVTMRPPQLILLDLRMPMMDGWAFVRALRERGSTVPIIVMTAERNGRMWAEQLAAAAYLAKPYDLDELLALVERCRGQRRDDLPRA